MQAHAIYNPLTLADKLANTHIVTTTPYLHTNSCLYNGTHNQGMPAQPLTDWLRWPLIAERIWNKFV